LSYPTYILVFAKWPSEVEYYRQRILLERNQVRFVVDQKTLMGLHIENRPVHMPYVGDFWYRADADELVAYARQIGIIVSPSSHPNIYDPRLLVHDQSIVYNPLGTKLWKADHETPSTVDDHLEDDQQRRIP
jgi:hypothetical protein